VVFVSSLSAWADTQEDLEKPPFACPRAVYALDYEGWCLFEAQFARLKGRDLVDENIENVGTDPFSRELFGIKSALSDMAI
jgi:hypothetical protein